MENNFEKKQGAEGVQERRAFLKRAGAASALPAAVVLLNASAKQASGQFPGGITTRYIGACSFTDCPPPTGGGD